jgi:hypothetical protein
VFLVLFSQTFVSGCTRQLGQGGVESSSEGLLAGRDMMPSSATASNMVGSGCAWPFLKCIDDGTSFSSSDDDKTVAENAGSAPGVHTLGFSKCATGMVGTVVVHYRASVSSSATKGTVQINLYDGPNLIASGNSHDLAKTWKNFDETFSSLNVASVDKLKVVVTLSRTAGPGKARYTILWITTMPPAVQPDASALDTGVVHLKDAASGVDIAVSGSDGASSGTDGGVMPDASPTPSIDGGVTDGASSLVPEPSQVMVCPTTDFAGSACRLLTVGNFRDPTTMGLSGPVLSMKVGSAVRALTFGDIGYDERPANGEEEAGVEVSDLSLFGPNSGVWSLRVEPTTTWDCKASASAAPPVPAVAFYTDLAFGKVGSCVVLGLGVYNTTDDIGLRDNSIQSLESGGGSPDCPSGSLLGADLFTDFDLAGTSAKGVFNAPSLPTNQNITGISSLQVRCVKLF